MSEPIEFRSDDEILSAYLDGMLTDAQRAELARRLQQEPALAERLTRLRRADSAVRDAYAPVLDEPLPQAVLDMLATGDRAEPESSTVVDFTKRRRRAAAATPSWPLALAASFTLAVGVGLGYLLAGSGGDAELALLARAGVIEPGSPLHAALETGPSGSTREIGEDLRAMPILSFVAQDGEVCRQLELGGTRTSAEALACRRNGAWQLEALGFLPERPFGGDPDAFRPAGAASSAIDALIDERIAGDPLSSESEQRLIDNDWSR